MPNSIRTTPKTQTTSPAHQASYGLDAGLSILETSQRKIIDLTTIDDDEVILLPSLMLSNLACDINGAASALHDIGQLLALIHYGKVEQHEAASLARLAHDAADTWSNLLYEKLESINKPLAMTAYGKEGAQ